MIASPFTSAQGFIKALKARPDPHADGPQKIELAREAWNNTNFDFPSKDEVLVDWLLTRLLKDKAIAGDANPILDSRYWQLLSDILCSPGREAQHADTSRAARRWLMPLLNRTPLAPIVTAYFTLSASLDERTRAGLNEPLAQCLAVLWPLASLKFSPDVLLECFGALLAYLTAIQPAEDHCFSIDPRIARAGALIISSYRTAYGNTVNKKKLYTVFLQDHFLPWIQCSQQDDTRHEGQCPPVLDTFSAGIDTMFNVDILRSLDDHKCDAALRDAINRALVSSRGAVLRILPRLFASFVHSVKKNRNALYGQGSSAGPGYAAVQVQIDGLAFYALCEASISESPNLDTPLTWDTTIALLKTVDSEGLYNASDANSTQVLRSSGNAAVGVFASSCHDASLINKAIDVLIVLTHIDFDLMAPELPAVWPMLARCPPSPSSSSYLRLLLDFHTKTRTVNVLVDAWLDATSIRHWQSVGLQPREAYNSMLGSPLFTLEAVDWIGQAIRAYLTPNQILEVACLATERLQDAFQRFRAQDKLVASADGEGARKKRKSSAVEDARIDPEGFAVDFALVAKIVVVVLGSLAIRTTLEDSRREIYDAVSAACAAIVPCASKAVLQALDANNRRPSWAWQVVATGALLVYHGRKDRGWPEVHMDEDVKRQLCSLLGKDDVLPEFSLTIVRALINDRGGGQDTLANVLRCLEGLQTSGGQNELTWSGRSHEQDSSDTQATVAILHLVLSRWLPLFESQATAEQLTRLAKVILRLSPSAASTPRTSTGMTPATVLVTTLHDATFWELCRFREAFLGQLHEATQSLANVDTEKLLRSASSVGRTYAKVSVGIATFEILLHVPEEYITRPLRLDFLQRAIAADVIIGMTAMKKEGMDVRKLVMVREYVHRAISQSGSIAQIGIDGYLTYLLKSSSERPMLTSVTLQLISDYISAFFRKAKDGEERYAVETVEEIKRCLSVTPERSLHTTHSITDGALLRLVSTVASNYDMSQLPLKLQQSLRDLYEEMNSTYSTQWTRTFPGDGTQGCNPRDSSGTILRMWSHTLWLGRWMGIDMTALPRFGTVLLGQQLVDRNRSLDRETCLSLIDVLKEELFSAAQEHRKTYVGCVVAAYVAYVRINNTKDADNLDQVLSNLSRGLTILDYEAALDYIVEAAGSTSFDVMELASLLRLLKVVGLNAPEGTSKMTQQAVSKTLMVCADRPGYLVAPQIRSELLGLLAGFCSDRPAFIRASDMSTIWSILGQFLVGSLEHDHATHPAVFQEVVNVASALVRLRRDLVVNNLPHLGMILRRLTSCLRAPRTQLGAKQTRLVMNTLPAWITSARAMSAEEAKSLARLMTTLTTKTIVRTHGQSAETQKPESLARPFSKHAAYVLAAYIEAVNDPLCHILPQVRKELQPGLFALCDMLGDSNRDAMMVSALDASGKVMMKALWKEYEKQKYVGRG